MRAADIMLVKGWQTLNSSGLRAGTWLAAARPASPECASHLDTCFKWVRLFLCNEMKVTVQPVLQNDEV